MLTCKHIYVCTKRVYVIMPQFQICIQKNFKRLQKIWKSKIIFSEKFVYFFQTIHIVFWRTYLLYFYVSVFEKYVYFLACFVNSPVWMYYWFFATLPNFLSSLFIRQVYFRKLTDRVNVDFYYSIKFLANFELYII